MADELLRREVFKTRDEISSLRNEIAEIAKQRKAEIEAAHQEKLDTRTMPPMAQMTRLQKRYFLEPWMTAFTIAALVIALALSCLAAFTPLHTEFACIAVLFCAIAAGTFAWKWNMMKWNEKTEGQVQGRSRY